MGEGTSVSLPTSVAEARLQLRLRDDSKASSGSGSALKERLPSSFESLYLQATTRSYQKLGTSKTSGIAQAAPVTSRSRVCADVS